MFVRLILSLGVYLILLSVFTVFSSSEIMQNNPAIIIKAPIHQRKFVLSAKIKVPNSPEMMKFAAVEITVGTKVLVSPA